MHLNTLKPAKGSRKERVRVGRGIGSGLGKVKAGFEGGQMPMQRRLPKVGFSSKIGHECSEVLLYKLDSLKGDTFDFAALKAAGLVENRAIRAKIVKRGEIKRAVKLKGVGATAGAKAAIEAAGGSVE